MWAVFMLGPKDLTLEGAFTKLGILYDKYKFPEMFFSVDQYYMMSRWAILKTLTTLPTY